MTDTLSQFLDAIRATGLQPPDSIVPGKLHRFPGIGKRKGNTAGWCKLFDDCRGGCFGDWAADISEIWQAKRNQPLSYAERRKYKTRADEARVQAEAERQQRRAKAAELAVSIWDSAQPAMFHEYLRRKQVLPLGIRVDRHNNLLIPLADGTNIQSLQFIQPDGTKRFLAGGRTKGMFYRLKPQTEPGKLLICEGFATGATLYMETKLPVIVAFSANNMVPVAKAIRRQYPQAEILICGDNDHATLGNPGKRSAIEAARACQGCWTIPGFKELSPTPKQTDFNDLHLIRQEVSCE